MSVRNIMQITIGISTPLSSVFLASGKCLARLKCGFRPQLKKRYFIFSEIQSGTFYCLEQQNRNSHAKIQPKRVYLEFFIIF